VGHTLQDNLKTINIEIARSAAANCLVPTTEGEVSDCTKEMIQSCIYINMDAWLGINSYSGYSNLLYYFVGRLLFLEIMFPLYYFPLGQLLFWGALQLFNGLLLTSRIFFFSKKGSPGGNTSHYYQNISNMYIKKPRHIHIYITIRT
jgi:hypothetical protein